MLFRKSRPIRSTPKLLVRVSEAESTAVLSCSGRICLPEESTLLAEKARVLINSGKDVLLDLSEVEMIDSDGIGQLVTLHLLARAAERDIRLIVPKGTVLRSLEVANVASLFRVHSSLEAAAG